MQPDAPTETAVYSAVIDYVIILPKLPHYNTILLYYYPIILYYYTIIPRSLSAENQTPKYFCIPSLVVDYSKRYIINLFMTKKLPRVLHYKAFNCIATLHCDIHSPNCISFYIPTLSQCIFRLIASEASRWRRPTRTEWMSSKAPRKYSETASSSAPVDMWYCRSDG